MFKFLLPLLLLLVTIDAHGLSADAHAPRNERHLVARALAPRSLSPRSFAAILTPAQLKVLHQLLRTRVSQNPRLVPISDTLAAIQTLPPALLRRLKRVRRRMLGRRKGARTHSRRELPPGTPGQAVD